MNILLSHIGLNSLEILILCWWWFLSSFRITMFDFWYINTYINCYLLKIILQLSVSKFTCLFHPSVFGNMEA